MTYKDYILQFISEDTPAGDIARDIAQDPHFPATSNHDELDYYLTVDQTSCDSFMQVFERTFNEYQAFKVM